MIHVDNSLLSLFATCETRAWVRWGKELIMTERAQAGPQDIGSLLHVLFSRWLRGSTLDEMFHDFDMLYGEHTHSGTPQEERLAPGNVKRVMTHWWEAQALQARDFTLVCTERYLDAPLHLFGRDDITYYGTVDGLINWKGDLWLLEHKTTGNMDSEWEHRWAMSSQLQGYVWLLRQHGYPVRGAFVNGLELRKLPPWDGNGARKCTSHKVKYDECQALHVKHAWVGPLTWSDRRIERWQADTTALARQLAHLRERINTWHDQGLNATRMLGQYTWPGCGRCPYQVWCQAGRPVEGLTTMMTHAPWKRDHGGESS
jgi:hypothetical protein